MNTPKSGLDTGPRTTLIQRVTYDLAAGIIARSDFPKKDHIPETMPKPFTNFGHQSLIEHTLLQSIIWSTVWQIQTVLKPWKKYHNLFVGLNIGVSAAIIIAGFATENPIVVIGGFVLLFVVAILIAKRTRGYRKKAAEAKARELQSLLSGTWQQTVDEEFLQRMSQRHDYFGNGALDGERVPILTVISGESPFPGYGRLQAEKTFVCRPKNNPNHSLPDSQQLAQTIFRNVTSELEKAKIGSMTSGQVVTVYGDSITIESQWLNADKAPILWLPNDDKLEAFLAHDNLASCRKYFAFQIIFPAYQTATTLFIRPFLAGNAAACHVAVCTIGPPVLDKQHVRRALLRHRMQKEDEVHPPVEAKQQSKGELTKSEARLSMIRAIRTLTKDGQPFFDPLVSLSSILKLDFREDDLKLDEQKEFQEEFDRIVAQSTLWPGIIGITNTNIRDTYSYTFVTDYYGKPEMLACVRTMYDQICRSVLDTFDDAGFDISEYRDKEGHYSISADKIDNLIVGERIHIEKKKEESPLPAQN
jgi:hypothetical protein